MKKRTVARTNFWDEDVLILFIQKHGEGQNGWQKHLRDLMSYDVYMMDSPEIELTADTSKIDKLKEEMAELQKANILNVQELKVKAANLAELEKKKIQEEKDAKAQWEHEIKTYDAYRKTMQPIFRRVVGGAR